MYIRRVSTAVAFCLLLASRDSQQSLPVLSDAIKAAVEAQERGWELKHSSVDDSRLMHRWERRFEAPESERIVFLVERFSSPEAAANRLHQTVRLASAGMGRPRTDIGDEALLFAGYSATGSAVVYFRKNNMVGSVSAPSETATVRLARLLVAQIK